MKIPICQNGCNGAYVSGSNDFKSHSWNLSVLTSSTDLCTNGCNDVEKIILGNVTMTIANKTIQNFCFGGCSTMKRFCTKSSQNLNNLNLEGNPDSDYSSSPRTRTGKHYLRRLESSSEPGCYNVYAVKF